MDEITNQLPPGSLEALQHFFLNPVSLIIFVGVWFMVHWSKYFACQWLPLFLWNTFAKVWNATGGRIVPGLEAMTFTALCANPRKFLTVAYACGLDYEATVRILPAVIGIPAGFGWSVHTAAIIHGIFNPIMFFAVIWLLSSSNRPRFQAIANYLGAREMDLAQNKADLAAADGAGDATMTVIRNIAGVGKPPTT